MRPALRDTVIDGISIAVALWFLFAGAFEAMRGPATSGVAGLVIAYAIWRIARRVWGEMR